MKNNIINTIVLNESQKHLHAEFESAGKKVVYSVQMPTDTNELQHQEAFKIFDKKILELQNALAKDPNFDIPGAIKKLSDQLHDNYKVETFSEKAERVNKYHCQFDK